MRDARTRNVPLPKVERSQLVGEKNHGSGRNKRPDKVQKVKSSSHWQMTVEEAFQDVSDHQTRQVNLSCKRMIYWFKHQPTYKKTEKWIAVIAELIHWFNHYSVKWMERGKLERLFIFNKRRKKSRSWPNDLAIQPMITDKQLSVRTD